MIFNINMDSRFPRLWIIKSGNHLNKKKELIYNKYWTNCQLKLVKY